MSSCPALSFIALEREKFQLYRDSKSKEWGKIRYVNLESSNAVLEQTKRIQDTIQFTGAKRYLKGN